MRLLCVVQCCEIAVCCVMLQLIVRVHCALLTVILQWKLCEFDANRVISCSVVRCMCVASYYVMCSVVRCCVL